MTTPENSASGRKCAECGTALQPDRAGDLCPKCLLKTALGTQPIAGPTGTVGLSPTEAKWRGLPNPGEQFGHYRILGLLGRGGMGAAFEAEDLESGRRVALKVLSQTLDSPDARERFFREGRLAASINHPNSVYVFGTEEIGGTPVISMELVAGGTLQDRVSARGPMPVGESVDAVLQIIAGLDAAMQIGVLHRDVKPSNCFRDVNGIVKIGDFGLSISTTIRTEPSLTATGAFLGTPAFSSPEQLRGDEINSRSDMYSVGATLFYLLTGHTPFEAKNSVQLMAAVLEQRAPSPRRFRPDIPSGLAKVILRCLEKQPGDRFKNYAELAAALEPYSSTAPTAGTLGKRFMAGAIDHIVFAVLTFSLALAVTGDPLGFVNVMTWGSSTSLMLWLGGLAVTLAYFAVLEALWGATLGKWICRLRVVGPDNGPPKAWRAILRATLYVAVPALPYWLVLEGVFDGDMKAYVNQPLLIQYLISSSFWAILILLFSTARRRNGFAAVHDLATRTRVIACAATQARPALAATTPLTAEVGNGQCVGPYHILETLGEVGDAQWLLGYDLRLLRKVWLRVVPPGTPQVETSYRNIGRIGRVRWLTGRRSATENWDAFEAVPGQPLVSLTTRPQPWRHVRYWLLDVANELAAAANDGTIPETLGLDRIWIGSDGRARLLDFPVPGASNKPVHENNASTTDPIRFLSQIANAALTGGCAQEEGSTAMAPACWPLHARKFLDQLQALQDPAEAANALHPLLRRTAEVSQLRRAAIVAGCAAFPALAMVMMYVGGAMTEQWNRKNPELMELNLLLHHRQAINRWPGDRARPTDEQFAVYIAQHFGPTITNEVLWNDALAITLINGERRRFAEESVANHSSPTEQEIAEAENAIGSVKIPKRMMNSTGESGFLLLIAGSSLVIYVAIPAIFAALMFRGGLILLVAGVTFVGRNGRRASRLRTFCRSLIAWSPLLAAPLVFAIATPELGVAIICIPVLLSVLMPERGLADRIAGTWPVPR